MGSLKGVRIAIANRAEIAVRIAATCARMGAVPVLLLGDPDLDGYAARRVGRVERVGPAGSELDVECVVAAARRAGAAYLHPGYGFLSERPALAEACAAAGIAFVGPSAATLRLCGDKMATRQVAVRVGVPVVPASPPLDDEQESWLTAGELVGYPLMVKPAEAGGGRGLRTVERADGLVAAIEASRREAASSGAEGVIFLERTMREPRHVEVQVVADGTRTFALGDRDCSLQRRHQKVIEEAPAPNVSPRTRHALHDYACRIADAAGLRGIATCEFLLGADEEISFLEVNPRIQVEHPVTELVTGVDLVAWQLLIAAGEQIPEQAEHGQRGHAIEARVYAENPALGFLPEAGKLAMVAWPRGPKVRVDAGYEIGDTVPAAYDAMLAKVIAWGADRDASVSTLRAALKETIVAGLTTNIGWLLDLLGDERVDDARATTITAEQVAKTTPSPGLATIAAVAQTVDHPTSDANDPWAVIGPWRSAGRATIVVHGDEWEERLTVWRDDSGWQASRGEDLAPIRWRRDSHGVWTVTAGDQVERFAVVAHGDRAEVFGSRGRWSVCTGPRPAERERSAARASDGLVRAPLPASVINVRVAAGDHVARGTPLVTLSAMKMELVCVAPVDGAIAAVVCHAGELVAADQVLIELSVDEGDE